MNTNNVDKNKVFAAVGANLGFKTAFKATLGFYAAQFVVTLIGLAIFGVVISSIVLGAYLMYK